MFRYHRIIVIWKWHNNTKYKERKSMRRRYLSVALAASLVFGNVGIHSSALGVIPKTVYADEIVTEDADAIEEATDIAEDDPLFSAQTDVGEAVRTGSNISAIDTTTNFEYEEKDDGTIKITGLNVVSANVPADGVLKLPATINVDGKDKSVTEIGYSAFYNSDYADYKKDIKKIVIPGSVEIIGSSAFYGFGNVTEIEIPFGVNRIDSEAFRSCVSLNSIVLPESVTELGSSVFYDCPSLKTINVTKALTENWNSYCSPFQGADIVNVTLAEGITRIPRYLFDGMKNLESFSVPEGVTELGYGAFRNCTALKNVKLPKSLITINEEAFRGCESLEAVELPRGLQSIGSGAFYGCTSMNSVNLSELSVNEIPYECFKECKSLKRIVCSDDLQSIGNYAFEGCSSVDNIYLGENLNSVGSRAFASTSINEIKIPRSLVQVGSRPFEGCDILVKARFADKAREVPSNLFSGCIGLKDVVLPKTISIIGNNAFSGCKALEEIDLPSGIYSIGDYAFSECEKIETIKLGDEVENIGRYAFKDCTSLKSINLDGAITSIPAGCFEGTALENVVCSNRLSEIGSRAFANNPSLNSITLSAMTRKIDNNAFDQDALTIISVPASRAEEIAKDKGYTFNEGQRTTKLSISETGTVNTAIGKEVFVEINFEPADSLDEIIWSSSDENVATVKADPFFINECLVKGVGAGTATITVSMGSCVGSFKVNVEDSVSELEFYSSIYSVKSLETTFNLKSELRSSGRSLDDIDLIWESSNEEVAIVSGDGLVVPKSNGTTEIKVSDTKGYATAYCYFKVDTPVYPERISFDRNELLITGKPRFLNLLVYPEKANSYTVEWKSADESIATVNSLGQVTGVKDGETKITATVRGEDGKDLEATCKIKVKHVDNPVTGVSLSQNYILLNSIGSEAVLVADVAPSNADIKDILWTSDNEKAAVVDANGKVRATGVGEAVITAETMDGGYTATCTVEVKQKIESISANKPYLLLDIGENSDVEFEVTPAVADDSVIDIYSTNINIATVSPNKSTVTGVADGIAWIRCRAKDGSNAYATCKVYVGTSRNEAPGFNDDRDKVSENKPKSASENQADNVLSKGQKIEVAKLFTTANIQKFKVDNKKIATITKKGILKGKNSGEVTVEGYVKGGSGWELKESHKFKVEVPKLSALPAAKAGDKIDIKTYITGAGDLKPTQYESKNTAVAEIDNDGIITVKQQGKTKITVYYGTGKAAGKIKAKLKVN